MATLVNKTNPAIRMTAPEIEVHEEEEMYFIPVGNYCIPMCIDDWELVKEEPEADLEKEAEEYADKHGFRVPYDGSNNFYDDVDVKASLEGFKEGAKWMAEQIKEDGKPQKLTWEDVQKLWIISNQVFNDVAKQKNYFGSSEDICNEVLRIFYNYENTCK